MENYGLGAELQKGERAGRMAGAQATNERITKKL